MIPALNGAGDALTSPPARGEAAKVDHPHVQPLLNPDLVHDADDLQRQHILPEVVSRLRGKK